MKRFIYVWLFILTASCEKLVTDVEVPMVNPQLVMYAFLSPEEDTMYVHLYQSRPVFNSNDIDPSIPLSNAVVNITSKSGSNAVFNYNARIGLYELAKTAFTLIPGETYTVSATRNGQSIYGTTTVPLDIVLTDEVKYFKLPQNTNNPESTPTGRIRMIWTDPLTQKNYYRVITQMVYYSGINYQDTMYYNLCDDELLNDREKNGQTFISVCDDYSGKNIYGIPDTTFFRTFLLTTDHHYYEYHIRRLNYYGDDPFTEPQSQYSNTVGGLGCVASYRKAVNFLEVIK